MLLLFGNICKTVLFCKRLPVLTVFLLLEIALFNMVHVSGVIFYLSYCYCIAWGR